jgi:hypothetical protein
MVSFYDPRDADDQNNVEQILSMKGIEYCTRPGNGHEITRQILVAEEDLPQVEALILKR